MVGKTQSWKIHISQFRNLLQNYSDPGSTYWQRCRQRDQWSRTGSAEINRYFSSEFTLDKNTKTI